MMQAATGGKDEMTTNTNIRRKASSKEYEKQDIILYILPRYDLSGIRIDFLS